MKPRETQDLEYVFARDEGLEASCPQLLLALASFAVAMLWSLTAGAWVRLGRRIFCARTNSSLTREPEFKARNFHHLQNPS